MVKGDQVGLPATNSPLIIQPPLAGQYIWLSTRSGVFTPTEPLALNTSYHLALQPGLTGADGQRCDATLRWSVSTPPFRVIASWPRQADLNAACEPECKLAFNADVHAAEAGRFFQFRNDAGFQIPADTRQGTRDDLYGCYGYGGLNFLRTWKQDAAALNRAGTETNQSAGRAAKPGFGTGSGAEDGENAPAESPANETAALPNLLIVTPQRPLPIGKGWRLVMAGGMPAADGSSRSREQFEVPIGDVTPFVVEQVEAHHYLNAGPSIQVEFSKAIPKSLTNDFRDLIALSSAPANLEVPGQKDTGKIPVPLPNLHVCVEGRRLTLLGDFQGGNSYMLTLRPGLAAVEPFTLQGSNTFTLTIPHVPARMYFPTFASEQLAGGNRTFPLLGINVARVRVRAKLLDAHTAIHALRGYGSYFASARDRRDRDDWDEPYRSIDYNLVPGETVFDRVFDLGTEAGTSDVANKLGLNWDDLLGGRQTSAVNSRSRPLAGEPPALRTGVVFLDARRADNDDQDTALGTQALIQLTDLGMVWKKSPTGVNVFIFSHRTGQPVAGATARLFSGENQPLREAVADTNGLAHLDASPNAAWVAVQHEDDFHAVALEENHSWRHGFEPPYTSYEEAEDTRRVMLFSDRDLYRPGEAMHLEALVRDWGDQGLTIPAGATGTLQCLDARGKRFFQTNAAFSALGSWCTLVPLPTSSRGSYTATLYFGTNELSHDGNGRDDYSYAFLVQDFKPNAFEIQLPCKEEYAADEPVRLPLSARYLFGKSLSRAQVAWSLDADDSDFRPEQYPGFSFRRADYESRYGRGRSSVSLSGRGVLTGTNNFIIAPNLAANPVAPQPRAVSLLAEVTDVNQQTLTRRVEFVRHSSDFYLGLRQAADVLSPGAAPVLAVVAVRADGQPWPETVNAQLSLQRVEWQSVRVQGAGKTVRFHNEQVFTNVLEKEILVAPVTVIEALQDEDRQVPLDGGALPRRRYAASQDEAKGVDISDHRAGSETGAPTANHRAVPEAGAPIADLPALEAGEYLVEVTAQDAGGRPVISSLDFQVAAPAAVGWNYRDDIHLVLKPDHESYVPGDTAEILVEAPFSGPALVTVEREKVLRTFVTQLEGNAPAIHVPLEPGDVPNVFVSVTLLRGSDHSPHRVKEPEYRAGSCELPVLDPKSRLKVNLAAASTNCLPGRPVDVTVRVTDAAGGPVSGAEVVLYAVDDGILGLTDYHLPDPHGFFYAARPLGVQSGVSLPNLLPEDPDDLRFENKGYLGGGGGGRTGCAKTSWPAPSGMPRSRPMPTAKRKCNSRRRTASPATVCWRWHTRAKASSAAANPFFTSPNRS